MYIDPGTGGQLATVLLMVLGAVSGAVFVFAGRIRMFFAKLTRSARKNGEEAAEAENAPETEE